MSRNYSPPVSIRSSAPPPSLELISQIGKLDHQANLAKLLAVNEYNSQCTLDPSNDDNPLYWEAAVLVENELAGKSNQSSKPRPGCRPTMGGLSYNQMVDTLSEAAERCPGVDSSWDLLMHAQRIVAIRKQAAIGRRIAISAEAYETAGKARETYVNLNKESGFGFFRAIPACCEVHKRREAAEEWLKGMTQDSVTRSNNSRFEAIRNGTSDYQHEPDEFATRPWGYHEVSWGGKQASGASGSMKLSQNV